MISVYDIILYIVLYVAWYHTLISYMISYIHMVWYWMWYQIWYHDQNFTGALHRHPPQRQPQPRWRMLCLFNFPAYMDCNVGYQIPSSQAPASPSLSTEEAETDSSAPSPSSCTVSARSASRDHRYCSIWILATYDIVCHIRYRMSGHTISYVRCWMSYTISYVRYRIYDIALLDIRYRMYDIVCFYDIVCQHAMSYVLHTISYYTMIP